MNLEEVTIIIPTHNRNTLLRRSIDYYSNFNCNIIICDSSELKSSDFLNHISINYFHYPNISFAKKLFYAIQQVSTKYVCLSADDDFLSKKGLVSGIIFLENNIDYSSVQGKYVSFYSNKNKYTTHNLYDAAGLIHYNNDSPFQRVVDSSNNGMHLIYALHRTEALLNSFKVSDECVPLIMVEYTSNLIPLFYGKHKMLNILWMARDSARYTIYESKSNSINSVLSPLDLINYFNTNNGIEFKNKFIIQFVEVANSNANVAEKLFYEVFYQNYIQSYIERNFYKKNESLIRLVKNTLLNKYLYTIKYLFNKVFKNKQKFIFPFKEFEDDWTLIKFYLEKYSKEIKSVKN
jgi:glycosyltransferase domain-containing protein